MTKKAFKLCSDTIFAPGCRFTIACILRRACTLERADKTDVRYDKFEFRGNEISAEL
jgi:hypothetical protein